MSFGSLDKPAEEHNCHAVSVCHVEAGFPIHLLLNSDHGNETLLLRKEKQSEKICLDSCCIGLIWS